MIEAVGKKPLAGKTIHFTGEFKLCPQHHAERCGAKIVKSVFEGMDWLVKGRSPSTIRLEKANNLGIKVLDEKEYFELSGSPEIWREYEKAQATKAEKERQQRLEWENARAEYEKAWEIKRATMPNTRVTVDLLTECWDFENGRLIEGEEYQSLTADQLREAIGNGENDPQVVRDEDGTFHLVNAEFRGQCSINFMPQEREIILYEDGSFEVVDEG